VSCFVAQLVQGHMLIQLGHRNFPVTKEFLSVIARPGCGTPRIDNLPVSATDGSAAAAAVRSVIAHGMVRFPPASRWP